MGAVYVGEHLMMKRRVAIKTLLPRFTANANAVQRFQREAQAASAIGHPNIVTIHDLGQTPDGMLYIVMELLEGRDLAQEISRLRDQGAPLMVPERALAIMVQVAEGLVAAHDKGVVHRDLKPDNIFLTPSREGMDRVRLLDFGISKIRTPTAEQARLTADGSLLGTPFYMSPEQAQGLSDIDHRADIYAFGVILFELLTGRVPFDDENIIRVIAMHAYEAPPPPRQLNPHIDPALEAFVLQVMAKNPQYRYQTMAEVRAALAQFAAAARGAAPSWAGLAPPAGTAPGGLAGGPVGTTPGGLVGGPAGTAPGGYGGVPAGGAFPSGGVSPQASPWPTGPGTGMSPTGSGTGMTGPSGTVTSTPMQVTRDTMNVAGRSGRWGLAAVGVAIFAVIVGLGVAHVLGAFSGDGGESGEAGHRATAPDPPAVPAAPPPPPPQPSVPASQPVATPSPAVPTPAVPQEQPTVASLVQLKMVSEPSGAKVYREGKLLGRTPLTEQLSRQGEELEFVLKARGYRDYVLRFVPEADGTHRAVLRRRSRRPSKGKNQPPQKNGQSSGQQGLLKKMPAF
jgi:serine/threonine-protein kinase